MSLFGGGGAGEMYTFHPVPVGIHGLNSPTIALLWERESLVPPDFLFFFFKSGQEAISNAVTADHGHHHTSGT